MHINLSRVVPFRVGFPKLPQCLHCLTTDVLNAVGIYAFPPIIIGQLRLQFVFSGIDRKLWLVQVRKDTDSSMQLLAYIGRHEDRYARTHMYTHAHTYTHTHVHAHTETHTYTPLFVY